MRTALFLIIAFFVGIVASQFSIESWQFWAIVLLNAANQIPAHMVQS